MRNAEWPLCIIIKFLNNICMFLSSTSIGTFHALEKYLGANLFVNAFYFVLFSTIFVSSFYRWRFNGWDVKATRREKFLWKEIDQNSGTIEERIEEEEDSGTIKKESGQITNRRKNIREQLKVDREKWSKKKLTQERSVDRCFKKCFNKKFQDDGLRHDHHALLGDVVRRAALLERVRPQARTALHRSSGQRTIS